MRAVGEAERGHRMLLAFCSHPVTVKASIGDYGDELLITSHLKESSDCREKFFVLTSSIFYYSA